MKRILGSAFLLVMIAAPAFGSKSPTVAIPTNVQIGTTKVPAGNYKLTWTGAGPNVQATLMLDKKTVVTFSAKMLEEKNSPSVETDNQSGTEYLEKIHLNNMTFDLQGAQSSGQ